MIQFFEMQRQGKQPYIIFVLIILVNIHSVLHPQ